MLVKAVAEIGNILLEEGFIKRPMVVD